MRIAQFVVAAIIVALILEVGFGAAAIVLIGLAAVYVIAAIALPILVMAKGRLLEKPAVVLVTPDDASIPEVVRAALLAGRNVLLSLGFEERGMIHQPPSVVHGGYLALYRHQATAARALARVLPKPGKGPAAVQSQDVEFEMVYDNRTSVELSNIGSVIPGIEHAPGMARQMPHVREAAPLFACFMKLVAKYEAETGISSKSRVPLPDEATLPQVYYDQLERSFAIQRDAGLVRATDVPHVWRPTWRLAFIVAAGMISPGLELNQRRLRTRGERLQRALDGDVTRTGSERLGPRMGWAMMLGGVLLSIVAVVMSMPASSIAFLGMIAAWWLAKRTKGEPGWRTLLLGGIVAIVFLGVPIGIPYTFPTTPLPLKPLEVALLIATFLLPMILLTLAAVLLVEGFRAAAT